jgi:transposase
VESIDADLAVWCAGPPFAETVARLSAYRGITRMGGLSLAAEVCDWRRFGTAGTFMAFTGLTPSEHSSGEKTRRGHITHAGNVHLRSQLVESAWAYKSRPGVGVELRRRQDGLDRDTVARAWAAQVRLCGRFRRLDERKTNRNIVVTSIARELAGFIWAEMTA